MSGVVKVGVVNVAQSPHRGRDKLKGASLRFSWLLLSSPVPPLIQPEIKKYLTTRNHIILTIEGSVHILCPP